MYNLHPFSMHSLKSNPHVPHSHYSKVNYQFHLEFPWFLFVCFWFCGWFFFFFWWLFFPPQKRWMIGKGDREEWAGSSPSLSLSKDPWPLCFFSLLLTLSNFLSPYLLLISIFLSLSLSVLHSWFPILLGLSPLCVSLPHCLFYSFADSWFLSDSPFVSHYCLSF